MTRKPSSSHRGSRPSGNLSQGGRARRTSAPRRADDTSRGEAGRTRLDDATTSDQQAATRGRSPRSPAQQTSGRDHTVNPEDLRPGGRDGASEQIENRSRLRDGLGPTETGAEHQGMGRGHRRNFDESDDDATTRGQSAADETSETRDSGVRRRTRATDESVPHSRFPSRGGRSTGHRSDW